MSINDNPLPQGLNYSQNLQAIRQVSAKLDSLYLIECPAVRYQGRHTFLFTSMLTIHMPLLGAPMALKCTGSLLTFMPPPSMARIRTPRPLCPGRPTARHTSSFCPSIAKALMAATLTFFFKPSTCRGSKMESLSICSTAEARRQARLCQHVGCAYT